MGRRRCGTWVLQRSVVIRLSWKLTKLKRILLFDSHKNAALREQKSAKGNGQGQAQVLQAESIPSNYA